MRHPRLLRPLALLLLLCFTGSGLVVPVLDGLLDHGAGAGPRAAVHVEAQRTSCHAEQCALGLGSALGSFLSPDGARLAVRVPVSLEVPTAVHPIRRTGKPVSLPLSRAPPLATL